MQRLYMSWREDVKKRMREELFVILVKLQLGRLKVLHVKTNCFLPCSSRILNTVREFSYKAPLDNPGRIFIFHTESGIYANFMDEMEIAHNSKAFALRGHVFIIIENIN